MKQRVYVLEEYVGDFCSDNWERTAIVGIYRKKNQALKAKEQHLSEIDQSLIDGYCLTQMDVRRKGLQIAYLTEDLGK